MIENCEGPELLRAFYKAMHECIGPRPDVRLRRVPVRRAEHPGAALRSLPRPHARLSSKTLERSGEAHRPEKFTDFRQDHSTSRRASQPALFHPQVDHRQQPLRRGHHGRGRRNLQAAALPQAGRAGRIGRIKIEPLPDIDFNIRAGNTLVGYASYEDVKRAVTSKLDFEKTMDRIAEKAQETDRLFRIFREMQSDQRMESREFGQAKEELLRRLKALEDGLNRYLAGEYGSSLMTTLPTRGGWRRTSPFTGLSSSTGSLPKAALTW